MDLSNVHIPKERARKDRWLYAVGFEGQQQEREPTWAEVSPLTPRL
ncbi:MAG: hypothetical protein ABSG93_12875 [Solirubrobacteraceae bacterium]